jgi:predicted DNA repair protein MutK
MATSLLALLDDIASLLDDVSVLTKVAAKKTAGVLGDDLALNAQQVSGVTADRELPVVWKVARGAFLCYEAAEKLAHRLLHSRQEDEAHRRALAAAAADEQVDLVAFEKDKIKGAIRTDFILSAEIIVISLGTVAGQDFVTRVAVMVGIALLMTVGVYGAVAGIVKLDDLGLYLSRRAGAAARAFGNGILRTAPWLMKFLSVAGTAAMFLVGGSILEHGLAPVHHAVADVTERAGAWHTPVGMLLDAVVGIVAGTLLVAVHVAIRKLRGKSALPA